MHSSWYSRSCIFGGAITAGDGSEEAATAVAVGSLRARDAYRTGVRTDARPVCLQCLGTWRRTRNMKLLPGKERRYREVTTSRSPRCTLDDARRGSSRVQRPPHQKVARVCLPPVAASVLSPAMAAITLPTPPHIEVLPPKKKETTSSNTCRRPR